jgi:hypothetical protein
MVDRESRRHAVRALRRFLDCETTNDEYESEYPGPVLVMKRASKDLAIRAISEFSWYWFDDFSVHRLDGRHALTSEERSFGEQCVLFLQSGLEYEWKEFRFIGKCTGTPISRSELVRLGRNPNPWPFPKWLVALFPEPEGSELTTLGLAQPLDYPGLPFPESLASLLAEPQGDASVWPFYRQTDYAAALEAKKLE